MAFLTLTDGTTTIDVPVAITGVPPIKWVITGDIGPAIDGSMRGTVISERRQWQPTTTPLIQSEADSLETLLRKRVLTASGDWVRGGAVTVWATYESETPVETSPYTAKVQFTLDEIPS